MQTTIGNLVIGSRFRDKGTTNKPNSNNSISKLKWSIVALPVETRGLSKWVRYLWSTPITRLLTYSMGRKGEARWQ